MKSFTKEEIDAFLAWNGDAVAEITWDGEQDQSYVYSGTCQSGSIFGMDIGLNNDFPLGFSYVNWDKMKDSVHIQYIQLKQCMSKGRQII